MKILTFGIDNRALLDIDGHSKRWNSRMGSHLDRLDVIVEVKDKKHISEKWIAKNVRIIPIYVPHSILYSIIAYKKALVEYKKNKYDLVTTEEPFRTGFAGWLFKRKTGVPLSIEYHNDTFYNNNWLKERPISHRVYLALGKKVIRDADSIRCVNKKNYFDLKKLCSKDSDKLIEIIPVPTAFYDSREYGVKSQLIREQISSGEGDIIILYVGRLVPIKKVNELIAVFSNIQKEHNNIHLVVVGDGPEYKSLVDLTKNNESNQVIFTGYVGEDNVFSYYGAADIFVNPAHVEPYGRVYIEAMSAGKPVVTTSGAGAVEDRLCINNVNSLVTEPGNINELKNAIVQLIENKSLRERLGRNALKTVTQKFNYEDKLIRMKDFWDRTVQKIHNKALLDPISRISESTLYVKKVIKNALYFIIYYSGLLHLYIISVSKKRKHYSAIIINYHSFVEKLDDKIETEPTIIHRIDDFKKELNFIKRYFDIISLDDIVNTLKRGEKFKKPTVAITVDDGFRNNFDLLLPVLKLSKIPVTIFLTAGTIGTDRMIWGDKFAYMISATTHKHINTYGLLKEQKLPLDSIEKKRYAYNRLLANLKEMHINERDIYLEKFETQLAVKEKANATMLNWEQIRIMQKAGISFGAHTCTHSILTKMPLEAAKHEIADSKRIIEEKLGIPIKHFAYPNGRPQDFSEDLRNFCKDIGFESISSCNFGNNDSPSDVWALKRGGSALPMHVFAVNLARSFLYKKKYKTPAIVLAMTVNGLATVRSLARNGIKVYVLDSHTERPGMHTRYGKCLTCPDVQKDLQGFKDFLLGLVKKIGGKAILLPTSDAHNEFVNSNREELEPYFKFAMPSKPIMDELLNKKGQYLLAKKFDIPIPETYFPQDLEGIQKLASKLKYPVILKGLSTGKWRDKFGDKKAVITNNAEELLDAYKSIHDTDNIEPIVQEIIQGDDTHHYKICAYMDRNSNPLLTFTLQKIRQYPCDFGIGSSVISVWEPPVAALGLKYLRGVGYWGVGSIEFKKDARDGKFKMIEINPRLWAQNSLPDACGQNFALTAYLDILGEKIEPKRTFIEGIKWISFKEDRASFNGYHVQGRMSWSHWIKSIFTGKRIWAIWTWDDPMPFLKSIKFGYLPFEKVFSKIKKRSTKTDGSKGVSLEIIKDFDKFLGLRNEWNELLDKSNINNPFLRHEWISAWWKAYSSDKNLFIITFKKDGAAIGFIPLMKYRTNLTKVPINTIGFISNHWTRMDFILTECRYSCLEMLVDLFKSRNLTVILAQMNAESENFTLIKKILIDKRRKFVETQKQSAYMEINGDWSGYLKNQSHNFRMNFNKKLRRLNKIGPVYLNGKYKDSDKIIAQLCSVAKKSWQAKDNVNIVSRKEGQLFYSEIIKEWEDKDMLDFSILETGNEPISYMVGVKNNGCYFAFDTAYNKDFQKYSPGMLTHNLLLEKLFNSKIKRLDFGYIADYKKHWTEKISTMTDLTIFPNNLLGTSLLLTNRIKELLR